jgi:hypothetical protein
MARIFHNTAETAVLAERKTEPFVSSIGLAVSRGEFFAGLFILGFFNGIFDRAMAAIWEQSFFGAVSNGFGLSIFVWAAGWVAVSFLRRSFPEPPTRCDLVVGSAVVAAAFVPSSPASWIALTGLGFYLLRRSEAGSMGYRAALVVVAVTVPMLWSRVLFSLFSDLILQADAVLVSWVVGTERSGNTIQFADGWGYLFVAPGCSSLTNVSLAILGWVLFTQCLARRVRREDLGWCLAACAAVVLINVSRMGLIGLFREHYELIHGPVGAGIAGFLTLAAIIGINMIGARRELFPGS